MDWDLNELLVDKSREFSRVFGFSWILLTASVANIRSEDFCKMVQYYLPEHATHQQRHEIIDNCLPYTYDFLQRCQAADSNDVALEDQMTNEIIDTLIPMLDGKGVLWH